MHKLLVYFGTIAVISLAGGCASPLKVDIPVAKARFSDAENDIRVASVRIVNRAPEAALINNLTEDSFIPIKTDPSTRQTVESEIQRILSSSTSSDPASSTALFVRIERAEAHWTMGVVDRLPFVGIATVGNDREFAANVRFIVEVEKAGKVHSSYLFDERVVSRGNAALSSDVKASYERLILRCREAIEKGLAEFRKRYL